MVEAVAGLLVPLLLLAAGVVGLVRAKRRRRHRRGLAELAQRHRLTYTHDDRLDLLSRYGELYPLRQGYDRQIADVVSGPTSRGAVACFLTVYRAGFGQSCHTHRWLVAVVEAGAELAPAFLPPGEELSEGGGGMTGGETEAQALQSLDAARVAAGGDASVGLETRGRLVAAFRRGPADAEAYAALIETAESVASRLSDRAGDNVVESSSTRAEAPEVE